MNNPIKNGKTVPYVVASTAAVSGKTRKVGTYIGVNTKDGAVGETVELFVAPEVFELDSETGVAWTQGDVLYWDDTAKVWTKTSTSNTKAGRAFADKLSASATGYVHLNPPGLI